MWTLTRWTEASIYAVIITHLASLGVAAGVSTGTTTFPIHLVERACSCYSAHKKWTIYKNRVSDINSQSSNMKMLFLPHRCLLLHSSGFPPAWAHWREYSDMVEHKHEVLLLSQLHWSFSQALRKESVFIRPLQLRNSGLESRFLQWSVWGSKQMCLNCISKLFTRNPLKQIHFYIPDLHSSLCQ